MHIIKGNTKNFAIEVDISSDKWSNKSSLWIKGYRLGNWDDNNLLAPFLLSLYRVARDYDKLSLSISSKKSCREVYLSLVPDFEDPDSFYDLTPSARQDIIQLDKYLFNWGENFDYLNLKVLYLKANNSIKFLWVTNKESKLSREYICHDIPVKTIQRVFEEFIMTIPSEILPDKF